MNLQDQLDELRFNILRDTSDIIAGDRDSLWSDETLIRYIKDAEFKFCRDTLILRDSTTPAVTTYRLRTGVATYPLHSSIISVLSMKIQSETSDIQRSGRSVVVLGPPTGYPVFNPTAPYDLPPGKPIAFYTDECDIAAGMRVTSTIYPLPSSDYDGTVMALRCVRTPLTSFNTNDRQRCSEIPDEYQLDMLRWAAYRAQSTFDADAGAPTSAADHKAAYEDAVKKVRRDQKRRQFAPEMMRYGQNGFTWVR